MTEFTNTINAVFAKRLTEPHKLVGQKITNVFVDDREITIKTETGQWLHVYSYITHGDDEPTICFDYTGVCPWTLRQANLLSAKEYDEQVEHDEKYTIFCREQRQKAEQTYRRQEYLRLKQEFEGDQQ